MKNREKNMCIKNHLIIHLCNTYKLILSSMPGPVPGTEDTDKDKTSALLKPIFWLEERDDKQIHRSWTNRIILKFYSGRKSGH